MFTTLIAAAALLTGCTAEPNPVYTPPVPEEPVTVGTGFALGADISWATKLESEGEIFYNADGDNMECTDLMKELGMDAIRLRVWVDPEDGWCNRSDVLAKALRAQKLGMRLMIDFHYSDIWADPAKQVVPTAWLDFASDTEQLAKAVSDHTTDVLTLLKDNGIDVEWVQVGNEVTHGMLTDSGVTVNDEGEETAIELEGCGGDIYTHPENFVRFFNAGYDAVKAVYPDAQVIVHIDAGHEATRGQSVYDALETYGGKYDIIGLSLYPGSAGMSRIDACVNTVNTLYADYGKEVMIVEFGMPYDEPDTAYECLAALISKTEATGHCGGVFYWEPEAPAGYNNGYTLGAFENGAPTHALDAFTEAATE